MVLKILTFTTLLFILIEVLKIFTLYNLLKSLANLN